MSAAPRTTAPDLQRACPYCFSTGNGEEKLPSSPPIEVTEVQRRFGRTGQVPLLCQLQSPHIFFDWVLGSSEAVGVKL